MTLETIVWKDVHGITQRWVNCSTLKEFAERAFHKEYVNTGYIVIEDHKMIVMAATLNFNPSVDSNLDADNDEKNGGVKEGKLFAECLMIPKTEILYRQVIKRYPKPCVKLP